MKQTTINGWKVSGHDVDLIEKDPSQFSCVKEDMRLTIRHDILVPDMTVESPPSEEIVSSQRIQGPRSWALQFQERDVAYGRNAAHVLAKAENFMKNYV